MAPSYPSEFEPYFENRDIAGLIGFLANVNKDAYRSDYYHLSKATGAAEALGVLKDERSVEPLIIALESTQRDVVKVSFQIAAVIALGNIADPRAIQPLLSLLEYQGNLMIPNPQVCEATANALASIGVPAVGPILSFLEQKNVLFVHKKTSWPWKSNESPKTALPIMSIMYLVRALGLIGDGRAVQPLELILKNFATSPGVSSEAMSALKKIIGGDSKKS